MKIAIDESTVFPIGREMADGQIAQVLFMPQLMFGAVLKVVGIIGAGDFEWPIAIGEFGYVKDDARTGFHMGAEILKQHPAAAPSERVGVDGGHVKDRYVSPLGLSLGAWPVNRPALDRERRRSGDVW